MQYQVSNKQVKDWLWMAQETTFTAIPADEVPDKVCQLWENRQFKTFPVFDGILEPGQVLNGDQQLALQGLLDGVDTTNRRHIEVFFDSMDNEGQEVTDISMDAMDNKLSIYFNVKNIIQKIIHVFFEEDKSGVWEPIADFNRVIYGLKLIEGSDACPTLCHEEFKLMKDLEARYKIHSEIRR